MKKLFPTAVAVLACLSGVALAGPNYCGTITVHDANYSYSSDIMNYCGQGVIPAACEDVDTNLEGSAVDRPGVFKVYAAFYPSTSPRLKGMTFGVTYDPMELTLLAWGPCIGDPNNGAAEFADPGWPAPDTGTSIVFEATQVSHLVECYWFAGYNYNGNPSLFCLRDNPDPILGGAFADDSVPAQVDPMLDFGCMGFDTFGEPACPPPCDEPVPARESTWGQIKSRYH